MVWLPLRPLRLANERQTLVEGLVTDGVGQRTGARRYRAHEQLALAAIGYVPPIWGDLTRASDLLEQVFDEQPIEPLRIFAASDVDRHFIAAMDHCVVSAPVATHS